MDLRFTSLLARSLINHEMMTYQGCLCAWASKLSPVRHDFQLHELLELMQLGDRILLAVD